MKTTQWVDVTGLCEHLKLSPETIYRMTSANEIPFIRAGKSLRFDLAEVDAHLKKRKVILRKAKR